VGVRRDQPGRRRRAGRPAVERPDLAALAPPGRAGRLHRRRERVVGRRHLGRELRRRLHRALRRQPLAGGQAVAPPRRAEWRHRPVPGRRLGLRHHRGRHAGPRHLALRRPHLDPAGRPGPADLPGQRRDARRHLGRGRDPAGQLHRALRRPHLAAGRRGQPRAGRAEAGRRAGPAGRRRMGGREPAAGPGRRGPAGHRPLRRPPVDADRDRVAGRHRAARAGRRRRPVDHGRRRRGGGGRRPGRPPVPGRRAVLDARARRAGQRHQRRGGRPRPRAGTRAGLAQRRVPDSDRRGRGHLVRPRRAGRRGGRGR
jgi:hypothetical protein